MPSRSPGEVVKKRDWLRAEAATAMSKCYDQAPDASNLVPATHNLRQTTRKINHAAQGLSTCRMRTELAGIPGIGLDLVEEPGVHADDHAVGGLDLLEGELKGALDGWLTGA